MQFDVLDSLESVVIPWLQRRGDRCDRRSRSGRGKAICFAPDWDQIINLKHELVQLGARIDWDWIDHEIAPLYSDKGRPAIATRFVIGLLLLKHIRVAVERWADATKCNLGGTARLGWRTSF